MLGGQHRGSGDVLEATSPWTAGSGPAVHGTDCHLELCLSKSKSSVPKSPGVPGSSVILGLRLPPVLAI